MFEGHRFSLKSLWGASTHKGWGRFSDPTGRVRAGARGVLGSARDPAGEGLCGNGVATAAAEHDVEVVES